VNAILERRDIPAAVETRLSPSKHQIHGGVTQQNTSQISETYVILVKLNQ